jgi:hypothetical protein
MTIELPLSSSFQMLRNIGISSLNCADRPFSHVRPAKRGNLGQHNSLRDTKLEVKAKYSSVPQSVIAIQHVPVDSGA